MERGKTVGEEVRERKKLLTFVSVIIESVSLSLSLSPLRPCILSFSLVLSSISPSLVSSRSPPPRALSLARATACTRAAWERGRALAQVLTALRAATDSWVGCAPAFRPFAAGARRARALFARVAPRLPGPRRRPGCGPQRAPPCRGSSAPFGLAGGGGGAGRGAGGRPQRTRRRKIARRGEVALQDSTRESSGPLCCSLSRGAARAGRSRRSSNARPWTCTTECAPPLLSSLSHFFSPPAPFFGARRAGSASRRTPQIRAPTGADADGSLLAPRAGRALDSRAGTPTCRAQRLRLRNIGRMRSPARALCLPSRNMRLCPCLCPHVGVCAR